MVFGLGLSSMLNNAAKAVQQRKQPQTAPTPTQTQAPQSQMPSNYSGSGNPYNEILYNKKLYEDPNASQGQRTWASSQAQKYYGMLNDVDRQRFSNMNASAMENYLNNQKDTESIINRAYEPVDENKYRTEVATIDDIAKKYGFDYSRDYAKRQAEVIKQQKTDGINQAKMGVDNRLMDQAEALDRNYFQRYMQQAQNQVNSGINSGIAADQDLRLAMARQAEMGSSYRDANLAHFDLDNQMARLAAEATAYEDQLYNERLQQGFANAMQYTGLQQSENLALLNAALQQRGQDIGVSQYLQDLGYRRERDEIGDNQWSQQFDWQKLMDEAGLTGYFGGNPTFAREQFNLERILSEAGLTGYLNGSPTLAREQFETDAEWREYAFNNMSATEKAQFEQNAYQFGEEMAWRLYENNQRMAMEEAALQAQLGFTDGGGGGDTAGYYQQYKISSGFGNRKDPFTGETAFHSGIDIAMPKGASVKATVPGEVVYAGFGQKGSGYGGFGNVVVVKDAQGRLHQYSHLDSIGVKKGQKVNAGSYLGGAGSTGRSSGNHLEYMVKENGKAINPIGFLSGTPSVTNEATTRKAPIPEGGNSSYKNMYKTQKDAAKAKTFNAYTNHLNQAIQSGKVPAAWGPALTELIGRESTWNPNAKNPKSSAHGYGQFLNQTRQNYEKKTGLSYDNPVNQIIMTAQYVKDRYGSPEAALRFWDKNRWY